jgi:hypothetical protein
MTATIVILILVFLFIFAYAWDHYWDKREFKRLFQELKRCSDITVTYILYDGGGGTIVDRDSTYYFYSNRFLEQAVQIAKMRDCTITEHLTVLGRI